MGLSRSAGAVRGKGVERPWRRMREMARLVSLGLDGAAEEGGLGFREVVRLMDGEKDEEERVRKALGVRELTKAEMESVLRRRVDY